MSESARTAALHSAGGDGEHDRPRPRLTHRLATHADLVRYYGAPPAMTTRALVVLMDDEPVGVVGLAYGEDCATLFSEFKPALEPFLRSIPVMRAVKAAMDLVRACKRPVCAVMQAPTDILPKLGFEHVEGEVYRWPG